MFDKLITWGEYIVGASLFVAAIIVSIKLYLFRRKRDRDVLITDGMYGVVRHRHYLPILMIIFAFLMVRQTYLNLFFLVLAFLLVHLAIKKDEEELKKRNKEYEEYIEKVHWRLIPKVY